MLPEHVKKLKSNWVSGIQITLKKKKTIQSSLFIRFTKGDVTVLATLFDWLVISGKCSAKSPQQRLLSNKDVANIKKNKTKENKKKEKNNNKNERS